MRSCILCKFWGSSKTISGHKLAAMLKMPPPKDSSETIWYIGLKFSGTTEINSYSLSIFRNFNLLASSDNDKPTLMRQKCKQGFVYTLKGKLAKTVEVASKRGPQCKWRKMQSYPKVDSKIYSDTLLVLFWGHCDTVNGNRLAGVALIITNSGLTFQYFLVFWFKWLIIKMLLNFLNWKYFIPFWSCLQAEPPVNASTRDEFCILYNYTKEELCKGIITSLYVFGNKRTVDYGDFQTLNFQGYFFNFLEISKECRIIMRDLFCRYHFPPCDTSLRIPRPRRICRRSCEYLDHVLCLKEMISVRIAAKTAPGFDHKMINCSTFDVANGGDAPECYQYQPLPGLYL